MDHLSGKLSPRQRSQTSLGLNQLGLDSFATGSFTSGKELWMLLRDKKDYSASLSTTITLRDLTKLDDAILILTDKNAGPSIIPWIIRHRHVRLREIAFNRIVEQRDTISRILQASASQMSN